MKPEDDKHLRLLLRLLEGVKEYEDRPRAVAVQPRSSLWGDDRKVHPYEVSQGISHALMVSVDHFHCLRSSLAQLNEGGESATVIRMHSQYTLIRGALENAARALWVLDHTNRVERLTRRLRLAYKETTDSHRVRRLVGAPTSRTLADRRDQIVCLLIAAGAPPDTAVKTLRQSPGYGEIMADAGARLSVGSKPGTGAVVCESIWRACSSLAHGDSLGSLNFLEREVIESDGRVALLQFTGSIPLLAQATFVAVKMLERAFEVFEERATSHI